MLGNSKEKDYINYSSIFENTEKQLNSKDKVIVAIDGMCGSGKSHLAKLIQEKYDCNLFHMDDFFLPVEMKTKERLAEPGGNVHYERFQEEVLTPLIEDEPVIYRPYLCPQWVFGESIEVLPKKLTVIEGSYSLNPYFKKPYDLTIFVKANEMVQKDRILKRSNEEKLEMFIRTWIPLERLYFDTYNIENQCDIVVDTSTF